MDLHWATCQGGDELTCWYFPFIICLEESSCGGSISPPLICGWRLRSRSGTCVLDVLAGLEMSRAQFILSSLDQLIFNILGFFHTHKRGSKLNCYWQTRLSQGCPINSFFIHSLTKKSFLKISSKHRLSKTVTSVDSPLLVPKMVSEVRPLNTTTSSYFFYFLLLGSVKFTLEKNIKALKGSKQHKNQN